MPLHWHTEVSSDAKIHNISYMTPGDISAMATLVLLTVALAPMYRCTNNVIGTAVIASTVDVRQGSPTSCVLFVLYVNAMMHMIKQRCPVDGFLAWLHVMVMMDDTVILSTTRGGMKRKIEILYDFCRSHARHGN